MRRRMYLYRVKPGSRDTSGLGSDGGQKGNPLQKKEDEATFVHKRRVRGDRARTQNQLSVLVSCVQPENMRHS